MTASSPPGGLLTGLRTASWPKTLRKPVSFSRIAQASATGSPTRRASRTTIASKRPPWARMARATAPAPRARSLPPSEAALVGEVVAQPLGVRGAVGLRAGELLGRALLRGSDDEPEGAHVARG